MKTNIIIPNYAQLIEYTFIALKELGGSGKNTEINNKVAQLMNLSDEVLDVPHLFITNGLKHYCFSLIKSEQRFEYHTDIPNFYE